MKPLKPLPLSRIGKTLDNNHVVLSLNHYESMMRDIHDLKKLNNQLSENLKTKNKVYVQLVDFSNKVPRFQKIDSDDVFINEQQANVYIDNEIWKVKREVKYIPKWIRILFGCDI